MFWSAHLWAQPSDSVHIGVHTGSYNLKHDGKGKKIRMYQAYESRIGPTREWLFYKIPELHRDMDGAPDAYAPPVSASDISPKDGLVTSDNSLRNATDKKNFQFKDDGTNAFVWTGVLSVKVLDGHSAPAHVDHRRFLRDADSRYPVIEQSGAYRGYYRPRGAMSDGNGRPVNPLEIPFGVVSGSLRKRGIDKGDFGLAIDLTTGLATGFMYCDAAGKRSVGVAEFSEYIFRLFGKKYKDVVIIAMPGSRETPPTPTKAVIERTTHAYISRLNAYQNVKRIAESITTDPALQDNIMRGLASYGYTPPTP